MAQRSSVDLDTAIDKAGSNAALARDLGVTEGTVRYWKAYGVTRQGHMMLGRWAQQHKVKVVNHKPKPKVKARRAPHHKRKRNAG